MVNFKEDERLSTLNHSCAHVMAQAVKHLYPHAKFWVGPVVKEGFYYDIDPVSYTHLDVYKRQVHQSCKHVGSLALIIS